MKLSKKIIIISLLLVSIFSHANDNLADLVTVKCVTPNVLNHFDKNGKNKHPIGFKQLTFSRHTMLKRALKSGKWRISFNYVADDGIYASGCYNIIKEKNRAYTDPKTKNVYNCEFTYDPNQQIGKQGMFKGHAVIHENIRKKRVLKAELICGTYVDFFKINKYLKIDSQL